VQWFLDAFEPAFMQRALVGGLIAVVATSLVGTWVVLRGLAFLGDALAHGVIPGIALAVLWGFNPIVGALVAAVVMGGLVSLVSARTTVREDTSIGLLFVGMLSLGIVIVSKARSFATEVTSLLFGDILGVTRSDINVQLAAAAIVAVATVVLYRPLLALTFNEMKAQSLGLRPRATHVALMLLLAISIVAGFQAVGVLLVFGLLVGPPATASLLVRRIPVMMLVSMLFGSVAVVAGLAISFHAGTAGGATMAGLSVAQFFLVLLVTEIARSRTPRRPAHGDADGHSARPDAAMHEEEQAAASPAPPSAP
jgi:ABC-type Mn2+/Zn2+ transport system permease subunit